MYKIAICDDLTEERETLCRLTGEYFARERLEYDIAVFSDAQALLGAFDAGQRFDVYMLDILMPGMDGIELAKTLRECGETGAIIFISTTADYAIKGYSVSALDYIIKPATAASVDAALSRIVERLSQTGTLAINIKSKYGVKELNISQIMYVESQNHNVFFHMRDGSAEKVYASIEDYSGELTKYPFLARCHKSYIVNLNYVVKMKGNSFTLKDGRSVGISKTHLNDCRTKYQNHIFGKTKVFVN